MVFVVGDHQILGPQGKGSNHYRYHESKQRNKHFGSSFNQQLPNYITSEIPLMNHSLIFSYDSTVIFFLPNSLGIA
jgi:hypothetical protein